MQKKTKTENDPTYKIIIQERVLEINDEIRKCNDQINSLERIMCSTYRTEDEFNCFLRFSIMLKGVLVGLKESLVILSKDSSNVIGQD